MMLNLDTVPELDVSRETISRLQIFAELLGKWTKSINLVANSSVSELWERHIVDSAQIYSYAPPNWENWIDIGSGGGLPGLVIAVIDTQNRPVTLIESDQRKCLFLNTVRRELNLNVTVINGRIEAQTIPKAQVLTARALAPLERLFMHSKQLLETEGTAIFPKGERYQEELNAARAAWDFDVIAHTSRTHPTAKVLEITRIKRREH